MPKILFSANTDTGNSDVKAAAATLGKLGGANQKPGHLQAISSLGGLAKSAARKAINSSLKLFGENRELTDRVNQLENEIAAQGKTLPAELEVNRELFHNNPQLVERIKALEAILAAPVESSAASKPTAAPSATPTPAKASSGLSNEGHARTFQRLIDEGKREQAARYYKSNGAAIRAALIKISPGKNATNPSK